jgi:hypothetical protein
MKISKRRWFGTALAASAFITWLVLVCFVYRGRVLESHSYSDSQSSFNFTVTAQSVRLPAWIHFVLVGLGGLGIVLLFMPTRRQIDA